MRGCAVKSHQKYFLPILLRIEIERAASRTRQQLRRRALTHLNIAHIYESMKRFLRFDDAHNVIASRLIRPHILSQRWRGYST